MLFQFTSDGDLSGARVSANSKISMFSGNIRVGIGSGSRDHLVEQLVPWNNAGESADQSISTDGKIFSILFSSLCDVCTPTCKDFLQSWLNLFFFCTTS